MKRITIKDLGLITLFTFAGILPISASETKSLVQDILTNQNNRWKDLHLLPSQLIGSMILHNHPIVPFILNRVDIVANNPLGYLSKLLIGNYEYISDRTDFFNSSGDRYLYVTQGNWFPSGEVELFNTESGEALYRLEGHTEKINSVMFNTVGDMFLTASNDGTAKLWDSNSGKCLHTLEGHTYRIYFAEFNSSGDMVVTGSGDGTARIWDSNSGECLHTLDNQENCEVNSARFNGSGDRVLTLQYNKGIYLWDTKTGKGLQILEGHPEILSAEFSSSGDKFVTTYWDNPAKIWDTNGQCLVTLPGNTIRLTSATFNQAGDLVVTSSRDGTSNLWDSNSGECLYTLKGKRPKFNGSEDLVLTCFSKMVKLWEVSSGRCLNTLKGHIGTIHSAVFNDSGDLIMIASKYGVFGLCDLSSFLKLRNFFSQNDSISLNQALVLIGIYEIIIYRKLLRKTVGSHVLYFRRLKDSLKELSGSTEGETMCSDRAVFDFRKCPHLQTDYEKLPQEIQTILNEYVRKTSSIHDSSNASTVDQ